MEKETIIILKKFEYFARIGENYRVNIKDFPDLWDKLEEIKKKQFKFEYMRDCVLVWRVK